MHYYYPSETHQSFDLHPRSRSPLPTSAGPQMSLFPRSQDPTIGYYNPIPYKQNPIYQEDTFAYTYNSDPQQITTAYPLRDYTNFGNAAMSPTYSPTFFNKGQFGSNFNFNFESHATSAGSVPELANFDHPYKEKSALEPFKSSFLDNFICTEDETFLDSQFEAKEMLFLHDTMTNSPTEAPNSVPTDPLEHLEEVTPVSTFKVGGHGMKGWCEDDEKLLRKLAVQYKFDWKKIAKKFANKKYTPHFLKMRYKGHDEGPVPKRIKFTHTEDVLIAKYFNDYGIDWDKMVSHFPNRTPIMLKNRYYSYIRKNNRLEGLLKEVEKLEADQIQQYTLQFIDNASTIYTTDDKSPQSEVSKGSSHGEHLESAKGNDELAQLRAQVKSLRSLYAVTYRELNKLKTEK